MVADQSSNQAMSVNSHARGKPQARVTSSVSGIIASLGQVAAVTQPTVVIPPTNTNVIPPHPV